MSRGRAEPAAAGRAESGATVPERSRRRAGSGGLGAAEAARHAACQVAALTGREPEAVVAIERIEHGWRIAVEVVESRRVPDSADILAMYETELDGSGELVSYRRVRRYSRGRMHEEPR